MDNKDDHFEEGESEDELHENKNKINTIMINN